MSAGCRCASRAANRPPKPMPAGSVQQSLFDCSSATRIDTAVDHVWTIDE